MIKGLIKLFAVLLLLALVGCNNNASSVEPEAEKNGVEVQPGDQGIGEAENDNQGSDNEGTSQVDLNVALEAEAFLDDELIVVRGNSNLYPGAVVKANVEAIGYNMVGYVDRAKVERDGSFELAVKTPDIHTYITLLVSFIPEEQDDPIREIYGEHGEYLTGDLVYQYHDGQSILQKAVIKASYSSYHQPEHLGFEQPVWSRPSDYGETTVWLEPEVEKDEHFYYVTVKSNLVEGSEVFGNLAVEGYLSTENHRYVHAGPDGSLEFVFKAPRLEGKRKIIIRFEPHQFSWPTVIEAYGENGELLEGDLLSLIGDEKVVELEFPID